MTQSTVISTWLENSDLGRDHLLPATLSSLRWTASAQVVRQAIQFGTTIMLARLIAPTDFGLLGMALVVTNFVVTFHDLGTAASLIQRQKPSDQLAANLFWLNAGFGVIAMAGIMLFAPLVATFFREPRLTLLIRTLALTLGMNGFGVIHRARLERELAFATLAKVEVGATGIGAAVAIGLALRGFGVWSLAGQALTTIAVTTGLLWICCRWRPDWRFQWNEIRSVYHFSSNLVGFNLINYLVRNADDLLIGRYLGTQALGYYSIAYRIMLYPIQHISGVINRVLFPLYARLQNDYQKLRQIFYGAAGIIAMVTGPLMLGIMAISDLLVATTLGPRWQITAVLLAILAPAGFILSIGTGVGTIYQATGRTDWMLRWGAGTGLVYLVAFITGLRWGVTGVAMAYAMTAFILIVPSLAIPLRLINGSLKELGHALWRPTAASLTMLAATLLTRLELPPSFNAGAALMVTVGIGSAAYLATSILINTNQLRSLWRFVMRR